MAFVFHIPHCLLINFGSNEKTKETKKIDDVVALYNQDQKIIGYNLFCEMPNLPYGLLKHPTQELENVCNEMLKKAQFLLIKLQGTENIVVGKVLECTSHPNSDHLHITKVDVGQEILTIVCGAKNVCAGIKVVVAKVGTMMFDGTFIEANPLRNVLSCGMICSGFELNLPNYQKGQGILVLDDSYLIGEPFFK